MKQTTWVYAAFVLAAAQARAEPAEYRIDPEHVTVAFLVEHLGYAKVLGQFLEVTGTYRFDEDTGQLSDVHVVVDTASVSTNHEDRDEHLRSKDFLNSRQFPQMSFTADMARGSGERTYEIDGELELLGTTLPLTLNATWNKSSAYPIRPSGYAMGVSARARLERSDFGMDYGVDNDWVGNDVEIIIEFEARRQ